MRDRIDRLLFDYKAAHKAVAEESLALRAAEADAKHAVEARDALQRIAEAVQTEAHKQIAQVVTKCLGTVFGEDAYGFSIRFERKRGRTEANLAFTRRGRDVDPTSAAGGGVVDVAAFGLRLACLLLATPARRRLLVLDEPFRMLSRNYSGRVRELIETLSRELDLQVILVTHDPHLACGKVIEIGD